MTGNGVSTSSPTIRWCSRNSSTRCASTSRARVTPSSARSTWESGSSQKNSQTFSPFRAKAEHRRPSQNLRPLLALQFGEVILDFIIEWEAAGRRLRENNFPVNDDIELSGLSRLDLSVLAEAGFE